MKRMILAIIVSAIGLCAFSQKTRELKGVFKLDGEGMPGAHIIVDDDHQYGTVTDLDGRFKLKVPADKKFKLIIGMCICTQHHSVIINKEDAEVFLTVKKCKAKKRTIKKIRESST